LRRFGLSLIHLQSKK